MKRGRQKADMRLVVVGLVCVTLAACDNGAEPPAPKPVETEIPEELQAEAPVDDESASAQIGTPMEDRVATIGLLNKRNNVSQDLELKPGESERVGNVIVRVQACERTAPWEMPRETGAFVQMLVQERGADDFATVFSGWLFKESPSVNVVEHPIYDVWVKDCAMSFPGEEAPSNSDSSSSDSKA